MTAPHRAAGVANRELGTVERVDSSGDMKLRMDSGRTAVVAAGESAHRAFDAMPEGIGGAPGRVRLIWPVVRAFGPVVRGCWPVVRATCPLVRGCWPVLRGTRMNGPTGLGTGPGGWPSGVRSGAGSSAIRCSAARSSAPVAGRWLGLRDSRLWMRLTSPLGIVGRSRPRSVGSRCRRARAVSASVSPRNGTRPARHS